jgi:hypothetical protein
MFNRTSDHMARKSRVRKMNLKKFNVNLVFFSFRAFLASPILRELSSVRQENKIIKVTNIQMYSYLIFHFY